MSRIVLALAASAATLAVTLHSSAADQPSKDLIYVSVAGSEGSYALRSDGGAVRAALPQGDIRETFSLDGTKLAFSNGRTIVSGLGDALDPGAAAWDSTDPAVLTFTRVVDYPTFSPDARSVAFAGIDDVGDSRILVSGVDGKGVHILSSGSSPDSEPAWSPGGGEIVFTRYVKRQQNQLWVVNLFGGERQLPVGGSTYDYDEHPSWSPDGSTIAFAQNGPDGFHVAIVHSDGSGYRVVSPDETLRPPVGATAWSPNGREIAFVTAYNQLNIVNADGSDPHQIWVAPTDIAGLAWRNSTAALAVTPESVLDTVIPRRAPQDLRFAVRAIGGLDLSGVAAQLSFSLPGTYTAKSPTAACTGTATLTCTIGTISADSDAHIDLTARPRAAGHLTITVSASATNEQGTTIDDATTVGSTVSACTMFGSAMADHLRASRAGGDHICAGRGNDTISSVNGKRDVVDGGPGRDTATVDRQDVVLRTEIVHRR